MASWLGPALGAGGAVLSAFIGAQAQGDHYDNMEDVYALNYQLALRKQQEQEALNEWIKQLSTAPTTNLRGDRTYYDENTGWQIDPTQFTERQGALSDALASRQMNAAQGIQSRALDAREDQQRGEIGIADTLLNRMESRTPLSPSQVQDAQYTQQATANNDVYDNSIERVAGSVTSGAAPLVDALNQRRLASIQRGTPSLIDARTTASELDVAEGGNLQNQYMPMAERSTQTLPVTGTPEGPLMQAMMSGRALAPQTIGQVQNTIIPQRQVPGVPDWGNALAVGSIADAASGFMNQYQANNRWQEIMNMIQGSGNSSTPTSSGSPSMGGLPWRMAGSAA